MSDGVPPGSGHSAPPSPWGAAPGRWPVGGSAPTLPVDQAVSGASPPRPAGLALGSLKETNSPRIQSLSLEIGASPTQRGVALEDSWKGEILDGFLFLGDRVTASDADRLETLRITHVLNATEDVSNFFEGAEAMPAGLRYHRCPVKDRSDAAAEMREHFPACVEFLDGCAAGGGRALVHCRAGVSRSATLVLGYLMHHKRWDLKTCLRHVDSRRFIQPNSGFIEFLRELEQTIHGSNSCTANDFGYQGGGVPPSVR